MASSSVRVEGTDDKEDDLEALTVVRLFRCMELTPSELSMSGIFERRKEAGGDAISAL